MVDAVASPLPSWESFYVIVGSSGAALTGLQFVVIALVAEIPRRRSGGEIGAFGTPTVVHFGTVLLLSAILSAPWPHLSTVGAVLAVTGAIGIGYDGIILRRARAQTGYQPVFEDWLFHSILPFVAHVALAVAGILLSRRPTESLFSIAAASVLLLIVGIHNAWDTVTYLAMEKVARISASGEAVESGVGEATAPNLRPADDRAAAEGAH